MKMTPLPIQSAPSKELAKLFRRILSHASTDEGRPNIFQIRLEPAGGRTRLIATDGHRLAIMETDLLVLSGPMLLHRRACEAVLLLCKVGAYVAFDESKRTFHAEGISVSCEQPDWVRFPPWEPLIPSTPEVTGRATARELRKLVKDTEPGTRENLPSICLHHLAESGEAIGEGDLAISTYHREGVALQKDYVEAALKLWEPTDEVTVSIQGPLDPVLFEGAGIRVVIMPIRI